MPYPQHYFETAQICLNGHVATLNYIRNIGERTEYCPICGKGTIHECPKCNAPIRGAHYTKEQVITSVNVLTHTETRAVCEHLADKSKYIVPAYCYNCGEPYPWTKTAIEAATELIDEQMSELTAEEKAKFKAALPEVISDTPRTSLGATRIARYLKKVVPTVQETFKQIFYRLAADGARLLIWGS